eukprot:Awhi_evm1s8539
MATSVLFAPSCFPSLTELTFKYQTPASIAYPSKSSTDSDHNITKNHKNANNHQRLNENICNDIDDNQSPVNSKKTQRKARNKTAIDSCFLSFRFKDFNPHCSSRLSQSYYEQRLKIFNETFDEIRDQENDFVTRLDPGDFSLDFGNGNGSANSTGCKKGSMMKTCRNSNIVKQKVGKNVEFKKNGNSLTKRQRNRQSVHLRQKKTNLLKSRQNKKAQKNRQYDRREHRKLKGLYEIEILTFKKGFFPYISLYDTQSYEIDFSYDISYQYDSDSCLYEDLEYQITLANSLDIDLANSSLVMSLQSRDITPEDYELLLLLDETVPKATCDEKKVKELPEISYDKEQEHDILELVTKLPTCGHYYHSACIHSWLSQHSEVCPLDQLPVFTESITRGSTEESLVENLEDENLRENLREKLEENLGKDSEEKLEENLPHRNWELEKKLENFEENLDGIFELEGGLREEITLENDFREQNIEEDFKKTLDMNFQRGCGNS